MAGINKIKIHGTREAIVQFALVLICTIALLFSACTKNNKEFLIDDMLSAWKVGSTDWKTVGVAIVDPEVDHAIVTRSGNGILINGYDNGAGGEANWVRFIRERPFDKPFFFWFASHDAHRPWEADTFFITHDPALVEIPPYFTDSPETRRDIASYYNEIARFDYYVGKVRDELENQGVLENTVIIVMADNGRSFPRCKTRVYDSGMKTPFIFYWPEGIKAKDSYNSSLISAVDIAPTILELAGINPPDEFQGISFLPVLENPTIEIRNAVFSEHNWHDYEAYERMVRTKEFLYILNMRSNLSNGGPADSKQSPTQAALNRLKAKGRLTSAQADIFITPRPVEELYNVKSDPQQLLNLASMPQYRDQLAEMNHLLVNWQRNTGDTTPDHLTPDWYHRETGEALNIKQMRGTIPGSQILNDSKRLNTK